MPYFEGRDLALIESLTYNPDLEPYYDQMRGYLVWVDEICDVGMTSEGYKKLQDLLLARSFIHLGKPFSSFILDPTYLAEVWEKVLKSNFSWPGFNRLELSTKDMDFLLKSQEEEFEI